jgi:hypothetical protein
MRMRTAIMMFLILLLSGSVAAQQKNGISVEGGAPDDRASARLLYWNQAANTAAGQLAINYGRPLWRKDYEDPAKFGAMTEGKIWRMGSNFWTNLYSDIPVAISGKAIAPGLYFLGMERSPDGSSWRLAFIDPVEVRESRIDAVEIRKAPVEFTVPMNLGPPASMSVQKLTITLAHRENDIHNATLTVAWGHLALTAPVRVTLSE